MNDPEVMLPAWLIILASLVYVLLLFGIAYYGDRRASRGRTLVANPWIYALSIAVYCTAWTFYGSVGRAASNGFEYLTIYLGPTLMFALGWVVLRKMIRISKVNRITSIADFISSRYGKSHLLGGLVTIIAVIGIMPYISLQLKAVASSYVALLNYPEVGRYTAASVLPACARRYGAVDRGADGVVRHSFRHTPYRRHRASPGPGRGDCLRVRGQAGRLRLRRIVRDLRAVRWVRRFVLARGGEPRADATTTMEPVSQWLPLTLLSMIAIMCLPRQFQVTVVENIDERHLNKALWLFPLYMLLINLFVLPIALAGLMRFPPGVVDADTFVLALPMADHQPALALFAFIGGLSAATGMVIVETVALSTMISNDLVMPMLLRFAWLRLAERKDLSGLLLGIRRGAICFILLIGYIYFQLIGESYALVSIGLMSFAAAAQFAPALLAGMYWKGASRRGALAGISAGFALWGYTLLLPSFARSGWLPHEFVELGHSVSLCSSRMLFGLDVLDPTAHALFWSLLANVGAFVAVSLFDRQSMIERIQATLFVESFEHVGSSSAGRLLHGAVSVPELRTLAERFLGQERTEDLFAHYASRRGVGLSIDALADGELVQFVERRLAGAIGAASARVMVASTIKGRASASTRSCRSSTRPARFSSTAGSSSRSRRRWKRQRPT